MGPRYNSWVERAKGTKGSLECASLSRVRFNRADVNGRARRWIYKNCLPEEGPFKGTPAPGWPAAHVSSWDGSWKQQSACLCADSITVHYHAAVLTHSQRSFPAQSSQLPQTILSAILMKSVVIQITPRFSVICLILLAPTLCAAFLSTKGMAWSVPGRGRSCCSGIRQMYPAACSPLAPHAHIPLREAVASSGPWESALLFPDSGGITDFGTDATHLTCQSVLVYKCLEWIKKLPEKKQQHLYGESTNCSLGRGSGPVQHVC